MAVGRRAIQFRVGDKVSHDGHGGKVIRVGKRTATISYFNKDLSLHDDVVRHDKLKHKCVEKGCPRPSTEGRGGHCAKHTRDRGNLADPSPVTGREKLKEVIVVQDKLLKWAGVNFKFDLQERDEPVPTHFYGWWRKSETSAGRVFYAVDIFAKRYEKDVTVDSIMYQADPRINIGSLNADICAACNKWIFKWFNGGVGQNFDELVKLAQKPAIHCSRLETLDRMILQLTECRETALRCGGSRLVEIRGDKEGNPPILITMNLTPQAIALEGKVPSLKSGAIYDRVVREAKGEGKQREESRGLVHTADPKNIEALKEVLRKTKDPVEKRKIRATMRKLGHHGGARGKGKS